MNKEAYKQLLLQLLPQGLAWSKDSASNLSGLEAGQAEEFARVDAAAIKTLKELNPLTTTELINEWAAIALTDDDCAAIGTSPEELKSAVLARLISLGGSDKVYFQNVAKAAGFLTSVSDGFVQFRTGASRSGDRILADGFAYTWEVRSPENTLRYFRTGSGRCGDSLVFFGNALLECIMENIKPAHTEIIFRYQDVIQELAASTNIDVAIAGAMAIVRYLTASTTGDVTAELVDAWDPTQLQNLLLWYDAEEFTSNGDVTTWTDKQGNRDAGQATVSKKPAAVTNQINGRSILRFATGDQMEVRSLEQFDANSGIHFAFMADINAGGGLLFDRGQINIEADTSHVKSKILTTSYRANNAATVNHSGSGSGGVGIFQGDVYCSGASFGLYKLNQTTGTWTDVAPGEACRGPMIVVGSKLYIISSTVNKMFVWDGTILNSYTNTVSNADLRDLVYNPGDGLIYVAAEKNGAGTEGRLLSFNPTTNAWTSIGTGVNGCSSVACDGTNVYINKRDSGVGDIYKWNGSTFTSEGLSGIVNPQALIWTQGTLWLFDFTTGKITNKANSYTTINVPEFPYLSALNMLEVDGQLWLISDGNYFGGAIARLILDGTNLNTATWVLDQYGAKDLISLGGGPGDYNHKMVFIPGTNNLEVYANGGSTIYRIERTRYVEDIDTIPNQSLFFFGIEASSIKISINGDLVQSLTFPTETYRNPNELLEQIAITNGSLVTFVNDLVTINPSADLPTNAVIEVQVDSGAVTDWEGIDDWTFETA